MKAKSEEYKNFLLSLPTPCCVATIVHAEREIVDSYTRRDNLAYAVADFEGMGIRTTPRIIKTGKEL